MPGQGLRRESAMSVFFRENGVSEREYMYVYMASVDLLRFAGTRQTFNKEVRAYMCRRLRRCLQPFVGKPQSLLDAMEKSRTVISGSFALQYIFGEGGGAPWNVNDLDLYTVNGGEKEMMNELELQDYHVDGDGPPRIARYSFSEVLRVIKMNKADNYIDLIVARSPSPILPILQFHSTIVMNYVSPSTIFSAYPRNTSHYTGFPNPFLFHHGRVTWRTLAAYNKYRQRGVQLFSPSVLWDREQSNCEKRHHCTTYMQCPSTERSNIDGGCLLASLDSTHPFRHDAEQFGVESQPVSWILSNARCDGLSLGPMPTPSMKLSTRLAGKGKQKAD